MGGCGESASAVVGRVVVALRRAVLDGQAGGDQAGVHEGAVLRLHGVVVATHGAAGRLHILRGEALHPQRIHVQRKLSHRDLQVCGGWSGFLGGDTLANPVHQAG